MRGSGKTTRLLSAVADLQDDNDLVVFVAINHREADRIAGIVVRSFHDLEIDPSRFMIFPGAMTHRMRGLHSHGTVVLVDNASYLKPDELEFLRTYNLIEEW